MTVPDSSLPAKERPQGSVPASRPPRAKPQPKPMGPGVGEEDPGGSGSATGFVGMLARQQFDADMLSATLADQAASRQRQASRDVPAEAPAEKKGEPAPAEVTLGQRLALPLALVLSAVLLAIGGWAIGALVYMHEVTPLKAADVHYPLISWRLEIGRMGDYTGASKFMARVMLLCVPVAVLVAVMGWMVRPRRK